MYPKSAMKPVGNLQGFYAFPLICIYINQ